jgi:two-component sensor histidine kinase
VLGAEAAQIMAMVLHELVTNAAKYGALATQSGRVRVRWRWRSNGTQQGYLLLEWQEVGGPSVPACNASGYGTSVIRELLPYELGGKVDFAFAPDGVRCTLAIPAEWVGNNSFTLLSKRTQSDLLQRP